MALFTGIKSPCCNKEFTETDDIVVCPHCGTPHHRDCYAIKDDCCNSLRHESSYIWKSPIENAISGYIAAEELLQEHQKDNSEEQEEFKKIFDSFDFQGLPKDILEIHDEDFDKRNIYGVSPREITSFLGYFNPISLARFRRLVNSSSKISLNLFGGIFFPYYQFYHRHKSAGVIMCLADFLISVPNTILYILQKTLLFSSIDKPLFTNLHGLEYANNCMQYIKLGLCIILSLFYDYFYLRWMVRKIIEIRSKYDEENLSTLYYSELTAAGKPSFARMLLDYFITMILLMILFFTAIYIYAF